MTMHMEIGPERRQPTEGEAVTMLMDQLPIFATRIGYRADSHHDGASTPEETALADALFKVHEIWLEVKPS